jgi:predicted unusual protein kinase regulating ubiquinone biosynthesis (AarF/ABC1/UbiB family)
VADSPPTSRIARTRRFGGLVAGHPFIHVPPVDTSRSRRRVLVTELIEGRRFEQVKRLDETETPHSGDLPDARARRPP